MLVIRKEQIDVLAGAGAGLFEADLATHVKEFSPRHAVVAGDDAINAAVKLGIERAKVYGLTNRGPIRFFVEMMVMFGSEFDTDPMLPWANGVLTNPSIKDQMERADTLHEAMLQHIESVVGPDRQYLFDSIRRFGKTRIENYQTPGISFEEAVLSMLKNCYPEKCNQVKDEALETLLENGKEEARLRSITTSKGAALLIVLMFQVGHAATRDPLFPWISGTLDDVSVVDPIERVRNLRERSVNYAKRALENLGQD